MSPKGRPEGEFAPKRESAEGSPTSPKGRPEGEFAPERESAEGSALGAQHKRITLAFTGASGLPYGLRLLECLLDARVHVALVYSAAAQVVAKQECDLTLPSQPREAARVLGERYAARAGQLTVYGRDDWLAPMASGSNPGDGMTICPCTMGTLGAIAAGIADNLIARAADVMLKERRPLVLVPRETPLSAIHLENMLKLARAGAVILPPAPGFYTRPQSVDDLVDFVVGRVLDHLGVAHELVQRWGDSVPPPATVSV